MVNGASIDRLGASLGASVKIRKQIGIQRQSRMVAMATGSITILTGHYLAIDSGEHHFLFGDVRTNMKSVLHPLLNLVN